MLKKKKRIKNKKIVRKIEEKREFCFNCIFLALG